jgi:predicted ATPase
LRREVHVQEVGPGNFRTILRHLENPALDIDLIDTGEGMIQVLPVLTALARARHREEPGAGLVAIEEPESHLHPGLQRALAEHITTLVSGSPGVRVVLETHSEHLLLAVQLEIARGRVPPDHVRVYWVEQLDGGQSIAYPVDFDDSGRPQHNWPPGVFSEDQELARELLLARRERRG